MRQEQYINQRVEIYREIEQYRQVLVAMNNQWFCSTERAISYGLERSKSLLQTVAFSKSVARLAESRQIQRTSIAESFSKDLIVYHAAQELCGKFLPLVATLSYRSEGKTRLDFQLWRSLSRLFAGCNESNNFQDRLNPHPLDFCSIAPTGHFHHCLSDLLPIEYRS